MLYQKKRGQSSGCSLFLLEAYRGVLRINFNGSGAMTTGWQSIGGKWYYFTSSGAMATGWQTIGGKYYYFESSGVMAANKWVGNYYLTSSGVMATNTWIGNYYVDGTGKWVRSR